MTDLLEQDTLIYATDTKIITRSVENKANMVYKCVDLHVGDAVTLVGWGTQVHVLLEVADLVQEELGASCEVIDLISILPWDTELVCKVIFRHNNLLRFHFFISFLSFFPLFLLFLFPLHRCLMHNRIVCMRYI